MPKFDKKELKQLLDKVDAYDDAYYNENKKLVSDAEYDGLKDRLKTLSHDFEPQEGSKTDEKLKIRLDDALSRVGAPPPKDGKWKKVQHEVPMNSLNKVNLPAELGDWHKKCGGARELFITEKLDGISISLRYQNGKLVLGCTRGDGEVGEDITRNVRKMKGVPHTLSKDFTGHIRGEIVLFHSDWKKHMPDMANPRNAASGISKRIDGHQTEHLTVLVYTIDGVDFDTEVECFEYMKSLGFNVPNFHTGTLDDANKLWQKYMDENRETLEYDIDGLVVRINDRAKQLALGEENHRPKGAIAFKFEAPEARTIIRNIVCQVGDTGQITPVAEFDEVELLGAKVKRASLHNFGLIKQLGVNIGAEVLVERANDVIPYIKKVTTKAPDTNESFGIPEKCPSCGAPTVRVGEYVICPNKSDCPPQVLGRLNKWIKELGILEWGESILTKLIDSGKVEDVADIYKLKVQDITSLERMGEKGAKNLLEELDKYRAVTLENFLGGLCIDGVATSTAKAIIDAGHDTLDKILGLSVNQLESIPGFGEKKAQAFHDGLVENANRIEAILNAGVSIKARAKGNLTGTSFCFTGSMDTSRTLLQKMVEEAGGTVKNSVGKGLTYLVIADPNSTSSKAQAARKLDVKLLSESDFLDLVKKK